MLSALPWQRLLRRELLILYLVIFIADTVVGYLLPLYPVRARALGASLTLIGSLAAFNGATQVMSSVPVGMLSDRFGRRRLIAGARSALQLLQPSSPLHRRPCICSSPRFFWGLESSPFLPWAPQWSATTVHPRNVG